jgi:hypothetical protein
MASAFVDRPKLPNQDSGEEDTRGHGRPRSKCCFVSRNWKLTRRLELLTGFAKFKLTGVLEMVEKDACRSPVPGLDATLAYYIWDRALGKRVRRIPTAVPECGLYDASSQRILKRWL